MSLCPLGFEPCGPPDRFSPFAPCRPGAARTAVAGYSRVPWEPEALTVCMQLGTTGSELARQVAEERLVLFARVVLRVCDARRWMQRDDKPLCTLWVEMVSQLCSDCAQIPLLFFRSGISIPVASLELDFISGARSKSWSRDEVCSNRSVTALEPTGEKPLPLLVISWCPDLIEAIQSRTFAESV